MSNGNGSGGGIGILGMLGIAFVVLKRFGFIDWSWWWVTLPFWGVFALLAAIVAIEIAVKAVAAICRIKKGSEP